ncbi:hypothetical protein CO038_03995 [Candidatus Pacearchaeota archaeon CG_4_9_14_0_2_um_filter_39_13]|nr:hypothetical protein [Candidatus Pacearchaeota archaeon]OIO44297.1 MAG: hypothetical protein AUJ64_00365 [Candidatus Pacearchaeota archaeon CG1_02_39_14]PJC44347.1 MAG: hypothetical protein CO038_03995 [Candidatus Pacearchaeota archaeon CG_4_9_14_0_2_um_filter_39_13]
MKLNKKKELAARTLGVGKSRISFNVNRIDEIKEAITKQDIKELVSGGAISIKEIRGTRTKKKRKTRRRAGSIKIKVNTRKRDYMTITRKLRAYAAELRKRSQIGQEEFKQLRKEVRLRKFKSLSNMKERVKEMRAEK